MLHVYGFQTPVQEPTKLLLFIDISIN